MDLIIKYPDARLAEKSAKVTVFDGELAKLVVRLKRLVTGTASIGLSAPQVGEKRRVIVLSLGNSRQPLVMINPGVAHTSGQQVKEEGCTSIPGIWLRTVRPEKVHIQAQAVTGGSFDFKADGEQARAVMHEIDHLDGILLWDRLPAAEREKAVGLYLERRSQAALARRE